MKLEPDAGSEMRRRCNEAHVVAAFDQPVRDPEGLGGTCHIQQHDIRQHREEDLLHIATASAPTTFANRPDRTSLVRSAMSSTEKTRPDSATIGNVSVASMA